MRIHAILNRDGGTFRTTDMESYVQLAQRTFESRGHSLEVSAVAGSGLVAALDEALARNKPDVLLAGGGDGTISAAAGRCWKAGVPLGVVPAGTMNLFARSLQIPPDPFAALDALAGGGIREVDIATANGVPFIHQFSVGFHARMVRLRERMEYRSRMGKILASTRALLATIVDPPTFPVRIDTGCAKAVLRRASTISVSNNPFGEGHLPYADDPDGGELGVYIHPKMGWWEGVVFAWKAARGRLAEVQNLDISTCGSVVLEFPRRHRGAKAVVDGELLPLDKRVEIVSRAGGLKVLAPSPHSVPPA